jgi:uncharacterized protein (TIGR02217 family)
MSFHEVSLPSRLAFGSTGGVERRTEVVTLGSGFERRSTPWAQGRRRWLIGASLRSLADMAELVAFFEARRGRLYGFRFRDFMDFRSGAPGAVPTATDQAIGTGDGTTTQFQLVKGERVIAKPVAGSVFVAVDGAPVEAVAEAATGLVTLNTAPAKGAAVTAGWAWPRMIAP